MLNQILKLYGISPAANVQLYGSGLIHRTWKVSDGSNEYILQRVNHEVFKQPQFIAENINAISLWLEKNHPEYFFVSPLKTKNGESITHILNEGYFRLFPFVKDSHVHNVAK